MADLASSLAASPRALALALTCALAACSGDDVEPTTTDADTDTTGATDDGATTAGPGATTSPTSDTAGGDSESGSSGTSSGGDDTDASTGAPACPDPVASSERGFLPTPGSSGLVEHEPCTRFHQWYVAVPQGATVELAVTGYAPADELYFKTTVAYPDLQAPAGDDDALLSPFVSADGVTVTRAFQSPRSGEFLVQVEASDALLSGDYELAVTCLEGCELETTRFPIALVHGWTGFATIGPLDYFYQVPEHLAERGYPIHVTQTDKYNSSVIRSMQLAEQVDELLVLWRARKLNIIGHSQGGIDSRALISTLGYGDRVAALTTIATPHRGTYIMDLALGYVPGAGQEAIAFLLNLVGAISQDEQADAMASFESLSEKYMLEEFNPANPDDPQVEYISYTGRSCSAAQFLNPANNCEDLVDPLIGWGLGILNVARGDNDGLVTVESAKWGDYRGEMIADHIDEVGHLIGVTDPAFDHKQFYLDRARELADALH